MNVIFKGIGEIKPYENNPRNNDEAVEKVANSIRDFGWRVPIVIDNEGVIIAGHTRYKAAQKLAISRIPCVIADDLTPKQIKAYRIADNSSASVAEWNYDLLDIEMQEMPEINFEAYGLDYVYDKGKEDIEDIVAEPPVTPQSKKGDLYQLGKHRVLCGDSTLIDDVQKVMGGGHG